MSDIVISYGNSMQLLVTVQVCTGMHSRGCTGFDGGFAIEAAICGPGPHSKPELNINADENLAYAA